jgi:glutathionylspermidine synthase
MDRQTCPERQGWRSLIEQQGLVYWETETPDGAFSYWNEGTFYSFTSKEVYDLEAAARLMLEMLVAAGDFIIEHELYDLMGIPGWAVPRIKETWESEPPMLYGRFDFAYGPEGFKLLEYNADTPTAIVESAVTQWHWGQDVFGEGFDQWNSLHDALVARWKEMADAGRLPGDVLHLLHTNAETSGEDLMTVGYIAETARQAGLTCELVPIERVGFHEGSGFVDDAGQAMRSVFKLYPWEWMIHEDFAKPCIERMGTDDGETIWIEPIWKMLWSNKGILPVLWHLYPDHDHLLPAYFQAPDGGPPLDAARNEVKLAEAFPENSFVRKPLLAREGADSVIVLDGEPVERGPEQGYGEEGHVVQKYTPLAEKGQPQPVLGVWTVDMEPVGCGIRESDGLVTNNTSRFVPQAILG